MFASFTDRLNFGAGGGTVSNQPSAFPTRPIGQLGNFNRFAINFITVAGLTNSTQQAAINQLSYDLVNSGLMDKMVAVYPFVGGSATSHQYNLKDARDADTAFRLTFSGGWTHSSTGAQPNGTNAFANTFISAVNHIRQTNHHVSYYSRTSVVSNPRSDMGSNNTAVFLQLNIALSFYSGAAGTPVNFTTTSTATGFWVGNKLGFADRRAYRNGIREGINTASDTNLLTNLNIYIGARNNNNASVDQYSNRECAFATIGDSLTDAEVATLYTIVQNYQTLLGRQV